MADREEKSMGERNPGKKETGLLFMGYGDVCAPALNFVEGSKVTLRDRLSPWNPYFGTASVIQ